MSRKRFMKRVNRQKMTNQGDQRSVIWYAAEESHEFIRLIRTLASNAGKAAFSEANAMGLPKVYAAETEIILLQKDGNTKVIKRAPESGEHPYYKKFKFQR